MIDDLLSPSRIEALAPDPGGADVAWDEVRRRRRRRSLRTQAAAVAGLVAIVMVGVLPSLEEGGRAAELDVAGRDDTRRVRIATPSDPDSEVDRPAEDGDSESKSFDPRSGAGAGPAPGSDASTPAPSRPAPSAAARGGVKPPVERNRYETVALGCIDACLYASAQPAGTNHTLSLELCVAVGARTRRFSYATVQEVDLIVRTSASNPETVWTWSAGQKFAANEHHVDIAPGECVMWTTHWDRTDESGAALEPGTYRLSARSLAEQLGAYNTSETTFQISE